jgi:predicted SprT family Zn-dependent metalloprotease
MSDIDTQIRNKINECFRLGNRKFKAKAKIDKLIFTDRFKDQGGSAGWNKRNGWYIRLSKSSIKENLNFILNEIIPHEVAHVICMWLHVEDLPYGDTGHGESWVTVAKALGSSGQEKTLAAKFKYPYKTSGGNIVHMSKDQHDDMQNNFKAYRDRDGNRITAAGYQREPEKELEPA